MGLERKIVFKGIDFIPGYGAKKHNERNSADPGCYPTGLDIALEGIYQIYQLFSSVGSSIVFGLAGLNGKVD